MSITSRLFRKAVKVLRNGRNNRLAAVPSTPPCDRISPLEPLESRLLMSTVTIANIDNATEGGADGVVRITRDDTLGDLVVKFSATGGSGRGREFTLSDGVNDLTSRVTIPDGQASIDINLTAIDDTLAEPTETITFKLVDGSGYDLNPDFTTRSALVTITDNEPIVTVVATDTTGAESGTPASNTAEFTITRANGTTGDLVVNFTLKGSAKLGKDFTLSDGVNELTRSVIIPDGQASVVVTVSPNDDLVYEPTENVLLQISKSRNYTVGTDNIGSAVIEDNEPLVFVDPAAATPLSVTITTQGGGGGDTFVQDGSEAGDPHDNLSLEVRNAEGVLGADSRKAYIRFNLDNVPFTNFSNAILTLTLVDVSGASPAGTNFVYNVFGLKDDFTAGTGEQDEFWAEQTLVYGDAPGNIAAGGTVDLADVFNGGPLGSFNVVGNGTIGQRVSITGQLLTDFLNNETTTDADGDNLVTFIIVRENVGAADDTIIHAFGARDDGSGDPPELTCVGPLVGLEIDEGDQSTIRIFRAGTTTGDITVPFKIRGTARLGLDYTLEVNGAPVTTSFVIPDGDDFVDITIDTINDDIYEIPETFEIVLRKSDAYVLQGSNTTARGLINDTDPVVVVEATDPDAQEPDIGSITLDSGVFTLARSDSFLETLRVKVRFKGTALNGKDFQTAPFEVVFLPLDLTVDVVINPNGDTIPEGAEDVELEIVPASHYGLSWILTGSNPQTGSEIGPDTVGAANLKQARQLAKNLGYAGPTLDPNFQSDVVTILNGQLPVGPDLLAAAFKINFGTVDNDTLGGSFGTLTLRNNGNQGVGAFNVRFFLSDDRIVGDLDDVDLGTVTVQNLAAFGSTVISITFGDISLIPPGSYILFFDVDSDGFVTETIEDNNLSSTGGTAIFLTP